MLLFHFEGTGGRTVKGNAGILELRNWGDLGIGGFRDLGIEELGDLGIGGLCLSARILSPRNSAISARGKRLALVGGAEGRREGRRSVGQCFRCGGLTVRRLTVLWLCCT